MLKSFLEGSLLHLQKLFPALGSPEQHGFAPRAFKFGLATLDMVRMRYVRMTSMVDRSPVVSTHAITNPAFASIRRTRANFPRLVFKPPRTNAGRAAERRRPPARFRPMCRAYLWDIFQIFIARTFFITRRSVPLSAFESVGFPDVFFLM